MTDNKRPTSREIRLLNESRNNWKEVALQRQKRIRELEIKVRDLTKSRDKWKRKADQTQQELNELKQIQKKGTTAESQSRLVTQQQGQNNKEMQIALSNPVGHIYSVFIIQLAIQQIICGLSSLRGCEKNFTLLAQFFAVQTPTFSTIRNWLFRFGLYQLLKKPENREDWIIIVDLTVELGQKKGLVILGITAEDLKKAEYCLQHQDVEVLEIAVLSSTKGEIICQKLVNLSKRIGTPLQIVADHGSDIKKGIELYQKQNPTVIYTYDITHKMALLLKYELEKDERFQSFLQHCRRTRQQTQQTQMYFLAPPKQRAKSRYLNLEPLVCWAKYVLDYHQSGNFWHIGESWAWDEKPFSALYADQLPPNLIENKSQLVYSDSTCESSAMSQRGSEVLVASGNRLPLAPLAADMKRQRFIQKLGWLIDYEEEISEYHQLINLVNLASQQVKKKGLNKNSKTIFVENTKQLSLTTRARAFKARIEEYLVKEGSQIPDEHTLLGTSDVIESIFGKYKIFSSTRPLKEIGQILLTIPVFTTQITPDQVKRAMESVRMQDVEKWAHNTFGQSMLSKRREVFKESSKKSIKELESY